MRHDNNTIKMNDPRDSSIESALRVLNAEKEGLEALINSLNGDFSSAVHIINEMKQNTNGRLIVAGIGKSGHVARKLAATFSSTGTPSIFVHPGEASHGDLGMIMEHDTVLMLSNSGENQELSDLIHYTRRFGITLISMTSNENSTLASHSDLLLLLPKTPEACPNGLAPTTSTTMMMALGDALAVALLEKMGLTREQFKVFHPGGKLGQKLLKVSELMNLLEDMPLVEENELMERAIIELSEKNMGCAVIVDSNKELKGIITDGDLKRHMGPDLLQKPVREVMTASPKTIQSSALAAEAMDMMTREPGKYLTSLIVLEGDKLIGLIRLQDCLQAGLA